MHLRMPSRTSHLWVCQIHYRAKLVFRPTRPPAAHRRYLHHYPRHLPPFSHSTPNPSHTHRYPMDRARASLSACCWPAALHMDLWGSLSSYALYVMLTSHIQPTDVMLPHRSVSFAFDARSPLTSLRSSYLLFFESSLSPSWRRDPCIATCFSGLPCPALCVAPSCHAFLSYCLQSDCFMAAIGHEERCVPAMRCTGGGSDLPRQSLVAPRNRSL
ncbi:hypothetical protein F4679DRAFT_23309 [Xylaria curta]|nr:hypothetical protein F4679DRAFT_23309 [Xylaria curta]